MSQSTLDSFLLTFTLGTVYVSLDYLVHLQFDHTEDFLTRCIQHTPLVLICLFFIFDRLSRLKKNRWAQLAFMIAAITLGCRVVYITTLNSTLGQMLLVPSFVVLWTFMIIELDLALAITSLIAVMIYYYRKSLMDFITPDPSKLFKGL